MKKNTLQVGHIAEAVVEAEALKRGLNVLRPSVPCGYDLVLDDGTKFIRVQVKSMREKNGVCSGRYSNGIRGKDYILVEDVDLVLIYCPERNVIMKQTSDQFNGKASFSARFEPCANNQTKGITWARDLIW